MRARSDGHGFDINIGRRVQAPTKLSQAQISDIEK